jgi:hypothetical protein
MRTIKTLAMLVLLLPLSSGAPWPQKNTPPKQIPLSQFIDEEATAYLHFGGDCKAASRHDQ